MNRDRDDYLTLTDKDRRAAERRRAGVRAVKVARWRLAAGSLIIAAVSVVTAIVWSLWHQIGILLLYIVGGIIGFLVLAYGVGFLYDFLVSDHPPKKTEKTEKGRP